MIKILVFDFGDVFINLNKAGTKNALKNLGVSEIPTEMQTLAMEFELGLLETAVFLKKSQKYFPKLSKEELINTWNAIILDIPEERIQFLENLAKQKKFKLILLSNTNALHISHIKSKIGLDQYNRFKNCFDYFYLSHEIQMKKPDSAIFNYVLKNSHSIAECCLFVDDLVENTRAASQMGLKVWNLNPYKEEVLNLFDKFNFNGGF